MSRPSHSRRGFSRPQRDTVGELDTFRDERPDYVISDSVAPWGQWVAQILDVPVVTSVTTFAVNRHVLAFAASGGIRPPSAGHVFSKIRHVVKAALLGRRLRRTCRVKGTGIGALVYGSSDLNIVYTSRYVQPCADTFDDRFLFIGPSIGDRTERASTMWDDQAPKDVISISLGTLFNSDPTYCASISRRLASRSDGTRPTARDRCARSTGVGARSRSARCRPRKRGGATT